MFLLQYIPPEDFTAEATILYLTVRHCSNFNSFREIETVRNKAKSRYFDKVRSYFAISSHRRPEQRNVPIFISLVLI